MLDGLTALGQSFVLDIVPPCCLTSSHRKWGAMYGAAQAEECAEREMSRVWGRHSPTSTTKSCGAISICEIVATGQYLLSAFSVSFESPDSKVNAGFQSQVWECEDEWKCLSLFAVHPESKFLPLF